MEQLQTVPLTEAEQPQLSDYLKREIFSSAYRMMRRESPVILDERTAAYNVAMVAKAPEVHPPLSDGQQELPVEF